MYILNKSIRLQYAADDERLKTFDRIISYPYGARKVCKTELLREYKLFILMFILMIQK